MASTAPGSPPLRRFDTTGLVIGVAVGIPAAIGTGAVLAPARGVYRQTNAALVLMIVVVVVVSIGGRAAGMITALAAVLSFDFLLVAGIIVGTVASSGRRSRHQAVDARTDIRHIHHVAEAAAGGADAATVIGTAQDELRALLSLRESRFEAMPFTDDVRRPALSRNGSIEAHHTMRFAHTGHRTGFDAGRRSRPSRPGPRPTDRPLPAHPSGRPTDGC
jgi:K+-sensing histidine kinase KdpD